MSNIKCKLCNRRIHHETYFRNNGFGDKCAERLSRITKDMGFGMAEHIPQLTDNQDEYIEIVDKKLDSMYNYFNNSQKSMIKKFFKIGLNIKAMLKKEDSALNNQYKDFVNGYKKIEHSKEFLVRLKFSNYIDELDCENTSDQEIGQILEDTNMSIIQHNKTMRNAYLESSAKYLNNIEQEFGWDYIKNSRDIQYFYTKNKNKESFIKNLDFRL